MAGGMSSMANAASAASAINQFFRWLFVDILLDGSRWR